VPDLVPVSEFLLEAKEGLELAKKPVHRGLFLGHLACLRSHVAKKARFSEAANTEGGPTKDIKIITEVVI
jgi:hypothetical protein